jgi:hypothetical protein
MGRHSATQNQYTLHTDDGCYTKTPIEATGQVLETNCYAYAKWVAFSSLLDRS